MMRQSVGALLSCLVVGACAADEPEVDPKLTVMTFNVLCAFCGGTEYDPWDERLFYFRDLFGRHEPDLIGLQELALESDLAQLQRVSKGYEAITFRDDEVTYADATIFYRSTRFEERAHGFYWLSPTPDEKFTTGFADGRQLARLVTWARLFDLTTGRELYFLTTHFDNNYPSQEKSAPLFLERTAPLAETHPVIITGDFNAKTYSPAYAVLVGTSTKSSGFHLDNTFDLADA